MHCRRSFSCQTFATDYWLKRPDILPRLMTKTCGGMANRQIARDLHVAPTTIDRQLARLGRHCLLWHQRQLDTMTPPVDITIDGFESFELSQYFPFHHHLAVDNHSGFFLGFTDSPLRRKGRMTAHQKRRRLQLEQKFGRPDPQAVRKDVTHLLAVLTRHSRSMIIRSDEHRAYPQAISSLTCPVVHRVTNSAQRRNNRNELWEINLLDLLIRHASGNHKRQTLAWSKRRQSSAYRLAVFLVWRNYVNRRWEKRSRRTPAMEAGICKQPLTVAEVLAVRLLPTRNHLSGRWLEYYWSQVQTPALGINRQHELKYAA
jgi:hypothetical protein